ncbi:MAG: UDP-2,4-diacetamido-2,4,6-trideoxy-beta-L-altropyranose hydrolase [Bacteroidales bacterium]
MITSKKKIYFRADADKKIGFGHFTRCLALADMLKNNFDCTFFTQTPSDYQKTEIKKICSYIELPNDDSKFQKFLEYLDGEETVVLDNYFFTSDYQQKIKYKGCKLVCIGANDRHYYSDVLISMAENDKSVFSVEPYSKIYLGIDWVILRKPFREIKRKVINKKNNIVICFGGTDQFMLTEKFVNILQDSYKFDEIHLIATDNFGKDRFTLLENKGVKCHINVSAEEIVRTLTNSKCLISSSSTISSEALSCEIPVICGYYVENQKKMYQYLIKENLVLGLSNLLIPEMKKKLLLYLNDLESYTQKLHKKSFDELENKYLGLFKSL